MQGRGGVPCGDSPGDATDVATSSNSALVRPQSSGSAVVVRTPAPPLPHPPASASGNKRKAPRRPHGGTAAAGGAPRPAEAGPTSCGERGGGDVGDGHTRDAAALARSKALASTLRAKQGELDVANDENSSLGRMIQALNRKLQIKDKYLRSVESLSRQRELELMRQVDRLESKVGQSGRTAPAGSVDAPDRTRGVIDELEDALSRLVKTQEKLAASELDLRNTKKKVTVQKQKLTLQQKRLEESQSQKDELSQQLQVLQMRAQRAENQANMGQLKARKAEETAAVEHSATEELQELVSLAQTRLQERDAEGAALAAKVKNTFSILAQKNEEMERIKKLLAAAHSENEKAIELEATLMTEKAKVNKAKKNQERAEAKLSTCEAKLAKRILEIEQLQIDLSAAESRAAIADQKVAQSKQSVLQKDAVVDRASVDSVSVHAAPIRS
jgi:hypothetical protein